MSVVDLLGRHVGGVAARAYPAGESAVTVDTLQLPSGGYVVRAWTSGGGTSSLRLTVLNRGSLD